MAKKTAYGVTASDVKLQGGYRNGGYRGADGKTYAWKIEAERSVAAGFKNDQRSFGRDLQKGLNIKSKKF